MTQTNEKQSASFEKFVNLADARLGTKSIYVSDDWFAEVNRMLQPDAAIWKEGVFDDNGKWMDGWESRRKRCEGYDYTIIRLGIPGSIKVLILTPLSLPATTPLRRLWKPVSAATATRPMTANGMKFCPL